MSYPTEDIDLTSTIRAKFAWIKQNINTIASKYGLKAVSSKSCTGFNIYDNRSMWLASVEYDMDDVSQTLTYIHALNLIKIQPLLQEIENVFSNP